MYGAGRAFITAFFRGTGWQGTQIRGGKDPGATQAPLDARALTETGLTAAAAGDCRFRLDVLADGATRVSVMEVLPR
jgi:hypothetical protein